MSVQRQSIPPQETETDLDSTAELPVLDVAAYEATTAELPLGSTDTWVMPPMPPGSEGLAGESVVQERNRLEAQVRTLSANLQEAEQRLASREERLAELERELSAARSRQVEAEARASTLAYELEQTRTILLDAQARSVELQRTLESREAAAREAQVREDGLRKQVADLTRELAAAREDLQTAQARAAASLESLQSREGRRGIFDALLSSRDRRIDELQDEIDHRDGQIRELQEDLRERGQRIAALEQEINNFASALARREDRIRELDRVCAGLKREVGSLAVRLQAHGESVSPELLSSAETAAPAAEPSEEVQALLDGQRARIEQLESELAALRTQLQERTAALERAEARNAESQSLVESAQAQVQELEARVADQEDALRLLQEELNASVRRAQELEADLHAAEDAILRLEGELRAKARLEAMPSASAAYPDGFQQSVPGADGEEGPAEIVPEGATRLLIRMDGDSEVVHVLGRKTTVGRTPDNDLQIDAKFISRHHAVILAGPAYTIIEDLNSTNGVLVNNRRITRQALRDGDIVVIGKTQFRYAVRAPGERR